MHRFGWLFTIVSLVALAACSSDGGTPSLRDHIIRQSACTDADFGPLTASIVRRIEVEPELAGAATGLQDCGDADTCDAFYTCVGIDPARSCEPGTSTCAGDHVLEQCASGLQQTIDCRDNPSGNDRCVDADGFASCAAGPCDSAEARCDGDVATTCGEGRRRRVDCGAIDRTCVAGATSATCVHVVEACEADRCDGTVALDCDDGLGFNRVDCEAVLGAGATCVEEDGNVECRPATVECEDGAGECDGAIARLCVDGRWETFDCGEFQSSTCAIREEALFGQQLACVLP